MRMFRKWQPHTEEYMYVWNSLVAKHTFLQLSESLQQQIDQHYKMLVTVNGIEYALANMGFTYDSYWLFLSLADSDIFPILPEKQVKWYYLTNYERARQILDLKPTYADEIYAKVQRDLRKTFGIVFEKPRRNLDCIPTSYYQ